MSAMVRIVVARNTCRGEVILAISALGLLHLLLYAIINRKYLLLRDTIILEAGLSLHVASRCRPLDLLAKGWDLGLDFSSRITKLISLSISDLS